MPACIPSGVLSRIFIRPIKVESPWLLRDANDNRNAVRFDALGRVIATFVMGKATETKGDPDDATTDVESAVDQPTTELEYSFRYQTLGLPDMVKASVRETHYYVEPQPADYPDVNTRLKNLFPVNNVPFATNPNPAWQESYKYSDGSSHQVLKKIQAEPGIAPTRDGAGNLLLDPSGNPVLADTTPALRWVGNGKTIFNNKGNPVKQYEPYFDCWPAFNRENELLRMGYTSTLRYDALGRVIRTDHGNGTFTSMEFDAWSKTSSDENDNTLASDCYVARSGGSDRILEMSTIPLI
jgi:YD repeat-containing protein